MKKHYLTTTLFLIILCFLSCSSDDDNSSVNKNTLINTWQLRNTTIGNESIQLTDCELQQTLTFKEDGMVENYYVDSSPCKFSTLNISYKLNGNVLSFIIPNENINGNDLIMQSNVITLTNTSLIIEYFSDNEVGEWEEQDIEVHEYEKIKNDE